MRHVDELRTERLLMRRWRDADRAPFAELNADPDVMRYFPATEDRAGSDRAIDRFERLRDMTEPPAGRDPGDEIRLRGRRPEARVAGASA